MQEKSLAELYPDIVAEWHPEKNGETKFSDLLVGSYYKYWWRCEHRHEWKDSVKSW